MGLEWVAVVVVTQSLLGRDREREKVCVCVNH